MEAPWRPDPARDETDEPVDYDPRQRAAEVGFRQAVRERDAEPYSDAGPSTNKG